MKYHLFFKLLSPFLLFFSINLAYAKDGNLLKCDSLLISGNQRDQNTTMLINSYNNFLKSLKDEIIDNDLYIKSLEWMVKTNDPLNFDKKNILTEGIYLNLINNMIFFKQHLEQMDIDHHQFKREVLSEINRILNERINNIEIIDKIVEKSQTIESLITKINIPSKQTKIGSIAISSDKRFIITAEKKLNYSDVPPYRKTIDIWNSNTGELIKSLGVIGTEYDQLHLSPDDKYLAALDTNGLSLWETQSGNLLNRYIAKHSGQPIKSFQFNKDSSKLLISFTNMSTLIDINSSIVAENPYQIDSEHFKSDLGGVISANFINNDKKIIQLIFSGTISTKIIISDVVSGRQLDLIELSDGAYRKLNYSEATNKFVTISDSGDRLIIYDLNNKSAKPIESSINDVSARADFAPDGKYIVYSSNKRIIIYDSDSGDKISEISASADQLFGPAIFSPDGKNIIMSVSYPTKKQSEIQIIDIKSALVI